MASNSFGKIFRITTWGESHGPMIGVVIDGCPSNIKLSDQDINQALAKRAPGNSNFTSPRKEPDQAKIASGVFEGKTTGAPISILIDNKAADSSKYTATKDLYKPGHANYSYLEKYGIFDWQGGGRASARETAARVAASAVARKILELYEIEVAAFISQIYQIKLNDEFAINLKFSDLTGAIDNDPVHCPCPLTSKKMQAAINHAKDAGDSVGGVVSFWVNNLPKGLGEPIYQKFEAQLAYGLMSIPATKGFEIGDGFYAAQKYGSQHNDLLSIDQNNQIQFNSNNHGGVLAGITTGMPVYGKVAFKPTSSIKKTQATVDFAGNPQEFKLTKGSKHDPCVAIRGVWVVKAMLELIIADFLLQSKLSRI